MRHALRQGSTTVVLAWIFWCLILSATPSAGNVDFIRAKSSTRNSTRLYSALMAESIVSRGQGMGRKDGDPFINYEHGTFQHALWDMYIYTKNETYLSWIKKGIDNIVTSEGEVIGGYDLDKYTLDDIRVGESMIILYNVTKKEKYRIAAKELYHQMKVQPRTAEGAFWHKKRYPQQQWLDGLYMAHSFYALYAATFEKNTTVVVFNDIGKQFDLVWQHCRDQKTGLLRHGYDYSKQRSWADPVTGASPEVWDRALGWYIMALVDFLTPPLVIPSTHPTYNIFLTQLRSLIPHLLETADPRTGAWYLVISQPSTREGNYIETSGTAMFIYGMLKAVRLRLVEDKDGKIVVAAKKAYEYLLREQIVRNTKDETLGMKGTVRVGSLDKEGDYAYYTSIKTVFNDLKGTAPFVMASLEYERLQSQAGRHIHK